MTKYGMLFFLFIFAGCVSQKPLSDGVEGEGEAPSRIPGEIEKENTGLDEVVIPPGDGFDIREMPPSEIYERPERSLVFDDQPDSRGIRDIVMRVFLEDPAEKVFEYIGYDIVSGDPEKALARMETLPENVIKENELIYTSLLISAGKPEKAREALNEIVREDPNNIDAIYNLSLVEGVSGNMKAQYDLLSKVLSADPDNSLANLSMGDFYLTSRKYSKAQEYFQKSIRQEPGNYMAQLGMGRALLYNGNAKESLDFFNLALQADPDNALAYVDRSKAYIEINKYSEADKDLSLAITIEPEYYWNYIDRGKLRLHLQGSPEAALNDFDRAIDINPDYFYAYAFRAAAYERLNDNDRAISDYETVLQKKSDYYAVFVPLGLLYFRNGEWEGAKYLFEAAFERDTYEYAYLALSSLCELHLNTIRGSKIYITNMLSKIPRENLFYHLLRAFIESGYDGYLVYMMSLEKDNVIKARVLCYLAEYYLYLDKSSAAMSYFQEVIDQDIRDTIEYSLAQFELERME